MGTTGIVAVLFTDLVGSTETLARLGELQTEQLREAHFGLVREAIAAHSGTDGFMVAFATASDAVAGAVAAQQAVERHISLAYEEAISHFDGALRAIRLSDDPLPRCTLLINLWLANWRPEAAAERFRLAGEVTDIARRLGDRALEFRAAHGRLPQRQRNRRDVGSRRRPGHLLEARR